MTPSNPSDSTREDRVNQVIAAYLKSVEEGKALDRQGLLSQHPDLAEDLEAFFADRDCFEQAAAPLRAAAAAPVSGDMPTMDLSTSTRTGPGTKVRYFGDYELLEEIGRGGMGVVYKAQQLTLKRLVALKMILAGEFAGDKELARFRAEAEAIARLQHPHIVQIHEIGTHAGNSYFSMEYLSGGSLAQKLDGTPWQPRPAAALVETLARAVQAAHEQGVVHRDLKPANVLLTREGQPKITDFGLAKRLDSEEGQTQTGAIVGTPSYMAPEQAEGRKGQIGPPADVYALAAILYELLTGRPPFKAATPLDTVLQVVSEEVVAPRRLNALVPRDLEIICLKCLQKEPGRRYAGAAELAEDLRRFQAGEPILARPVGRLERAVKWARRRPAAATLVGVAFLTVLSITISGFIFARYQQQRAETEERLRQAAMEQGNRAEEQRQIAEQATAQEKLARLEEARLREEEEHYRHLAESRLAESFADRGIALCEQGDVGRGLLWLARALQSLPVDAAALDRSIRANLGAWSRELLPLHATLHHTGQVRTVSFSPDGSRALTGAGRGDLRACVWDVATGKLVFALPHEAEVYAAAFSPDGKSIVTAIGYKWNVGEARLWSAATGKAIGKPLLHKGKANVVAAAFSPDGKMVVTSGADGTARLWDSATGNAVGKPLPHKADMVITVAIFSPDGKRLFTAAEGEARLWDPITQDPVGPPMQHADPVSGAAFSPDSRLVATCGTQAQLWDTATAKPIGTGLQHDREGTIVQFSPDGKLLLTASRTEVRILETATGKPFGRALQQRSGITCAAFSPDGRTIATGGGDKTVRLWDVSSRQTIGGPLPHLYRVTCFAFSPNGRFLLTGSGLYAPSQGEAKLWSIERTAACRHVLQHQGDIESASFSPDAGKTLLTGTGWIGGNTVGQLWDMGTGKPIGQPLPHEKGTLGIVGVAFAADGRTVLTGTGGFFGRGQLRRWDRTSGKLIDPSVIQLDLLESVFAVTVDGARVFTAGPCEYKAGVYPGHLWDSATGKTYGPPLRHPKDVKIATFSRNGALLLTGAEDSTLRLWDAATGMLVRPPARIEGELRAVAFSWDGSRFLTGTSHGVAQVWDATDFKPVGRPMNHEGEVRAVAFSPDGFWVLTGTDQQLARIWDVATSKPIGPALQHQGVVKTVLFSPDGSLLTGSWDKTCRIWNAPVALKADAGRVALSVQLSTGLALDDAGAVRVLNAGEWQECKKTLSKLDAGARTPKIYASMAGIGSRG